MRNIFFMHNIFYIILLNYVHKMIDTINNIKQKMSCIYCSFAKRKKLLKQPNTYDYLEIPLQSIRLHKCFNKKNWKARVTTCYHVSAKNETLSSKQKRGFP